MDLEKLRPIKKSKILSVRITKSDEDFLKKNKISPSKMFNLSLENLKKQIKEDLKRKVR